MSAPLHRPVAGRLATLLLAAPLLAGCAVGPDYRPQLAREPAPASFVAATPAVAAPGDVVDDWWRLYEDPALDRLVREALGANTDLRVAAANLAKARGVLSEARNSLYTPATQLGVSATEGRSATANAFAALQGREAHASAVDTASFTASYEVDLFGRLRRGVEAARADRQAAQAALDYARVAVAADTVRAYVEACAYGEAYEAARSSQAIARATADITRQRASLGGASQFDVTRAEALASQADAAAPAALAQHQAAVFSLSVLTGRPPEAIIQDAAACMRPPQLAAPTPVGDGASLLRRRPDVREAERQLAGDVARIGVATASLFPTITLGGVVSAGGSTPDKAFTYGGTSFSVGPAVTWNIPNLLTARARVSESSAQARASLARLDGAVLNALKDVETALSGLDGERQRNAALRQARDQFAAAEGLARQRYDQGSASFLDLLDAQRSRQGAEADLAASDLRRADAEVALFRALGGGWRSAPAVTETGVQR